VYSDESKCTVMSQSVQWWVKMYSDEPR